MDNGAVEIRISFDIMTLLLEWKVCIWLTGVFLQLYRQEMQEWQSMQYTQESWRPELLELTRALSQAWIQDSFLRLVQCCSSAKWNLISSKTFHSHADSVFFIASKLLKSTSQGASTTCYVALSPELEGVTGKYFADCNESECSNLANDESEAYKLWKQTRILIHRRLCQPTS